MSLTVILSFVVTTIISALMIPLVIKAGNQLGIVAHMNKRTVHKHEIAYIWWSAFKNKADPISELK